MSTTTTSTTTERKEESSPLEQKIQSLAKKYSSIFVFENLVIKPNGDFRGTVRLRTDKDNSTHNINLNANNK
jgi:hypothetical protein